MTKNDDERTRLGLGSEVHRKNTLALHFTINGKAARRD
jgi:hypothetical protein